MSSETIENTRRAESAPRQQPAPGTAALAGIRVVDLTQFEAGTSCTETLAWLGADVIKIEEPAKGEPGRLGPGKPGMDSYYFMLLNANKRSVTLNLKEDEGRAVLRSLIEKSDVLVENFGPGTIERLGLGWDVVRTWNPRLIFAQIKGFAPGGPFGKYLCQDLVAQAAGGVMAVTGEREGEPLPAGVSLADTGTGIHCALGIVSALYQRHITGVGQRIEVAMQEVVTNLGRTTYQSPNLGKPSERYGNKRAAIVPFAAYPCKGGGPNDYCCILVSVKMNKHWARLCQVIGREDLANDERFSTPAARVENRAAVDEIISNWTRQHDKRHVMKTFGDQGVVAGAVFAPEDLAADPFLRERGAFVTLKDSVRGDVTIPGFPVKMSNSRIPVATAPLLGEHTEEVYGDLLGFGPDEIRSLREKSII